jgi:superfamily II DNA or RNA helicase
MSASPWRDDGQDLLIESLLGRRIVEISASTLIEKGHLAQPIIKFVEVPKYHEKLPKQYQTVYKKYVIENSTRNNLIVDNVEKLINLGYKPLVLFDKIAHGDILYDMLSEKFPCGLLSGKDSAKNRDKVKEQIVNGEIKCLIASKIFDIGIDIPCLSALVLCGSGKASVRSLQRIGRVIRKFKGKKIAAIVDFLDNAHYLKDHSKARKKTYETEEGFIIKWPTKQIK